MILDYTDKQKLAGFLHYGLPLEDALEQIEHNIVEHEHGDGASLTITITCEMCKRKSSWNPKELADSLEWSDQYECWIRQCPCTKETWYDMECLNCKERYKVPESLIEEMHCPKCNPEWEPTPY